MPEPMRVQAHHGVEGLERLAPALDELHAATQTPVTARRRWLEVWARCYPQWRPWLITACAPDGQLVAAAALAQRRVGPLVRVVGLGHGTSDDSRFPARDAQAAQALADAVVAALRDLRRPWALLVEQLPATCPVTDALIERLRHVRVLPGQGMPMLTVPPGAEIGAFLSRNARAAENKARNRLTRDGHEVHLRWVTDRAEVAATTPAMSAVHRARDEQLGRVSDHDDPARARFYASVFDEHAAAGEVDLLVLEIDGTLAAYVGAFRDGRALRVWDNRVSPAAGIYSAGRLANHEAIRHVLLGEDYDVLDWMRGEEDYKLSSATAVVPTRALEAWSSAAARLPYRAKTLGRRVRDRSAAFDRLVGRGRAWAQQHRASENDT